MAGAFEIILGINSKNIENSIKAVIRSLDGNLKNQLLVQDMIKNIEISGEFMTKVLDNGACKLNY